MVKVMVFNATFNSISVISWLSVLLVEKTGVHGENHQPVASHWQASINSNYKRLYFCRIVDPTYKNKH
jgi:hypothetical protein